MARMRMNNDRNQNRKSEAAPIFISSIDGAKSGTSAVFNIQPVFKNATAQQILTMLRTQEVRISCFNKVAISIRGEKADGSSFIWGYINNLETRLDCTEASDDDIAAVVEDLRSMLDEVKLDDLQRPITQDEAEDLLASL